LHRKLGADEFYIQNLVEMHICMLQSKKCRYAIQMRVTEVFFIADLGKNYGLLFLGE
jgi:hypothetical protein